MGYTPPPEVSAGLGASSTYDESTWNTYIRDNMEFVSFEPSVSVTFYNPGTISVSTASDTSAIMQMNGKDWESPSGAWNVGSNSLTLPYPDTQYLVSVSATLISYPYPVTMGFETLVVHGDSLRNPLNNGGVGPSAYDIVGQGYPTSTLATVRVSATGSVFTVDDPFADGQDLRVYAVFNYTAAAVPAMLQYEDVTLNVKALRNV